MCGLGGNRGIGVAPCFLEKDFQRLDVDGLSFIKDYFSERYAHLMGDFVICRHTHEHIRPVGSFMRLLRRCLANRTDTVVFLEVPDTARMLGLEDEIKYIVNINHHQQGMYVVGTGQKIVPRGFLKTYNPEVVVVMNPIYFKEIRQSLDEMGLSCKILSASNGHL